MGCKQSAVAAPRMAYCVTSSVMKPQHIHRLLIEDYGLQNILLCLCFFIFPQQKHAHAALAVLIHVIQTFAVYAVHETPSKTPNCLCPR